MDRSNHAPCAIHFIYCCGALILRKMEWYKIAGLIILGLFFIVAILTDGFDWLNDDDSLHSGGLHP